MEYRLTHKCLSQTYNTTEHSAHYLGWVRVRLEKLTDTLMPLPRTHNTTPSPTFPPQMVGVHLNNDIMRAAPPLHRKTKRCLMKLWQSKRRLLGTSHDLGVNFVIRRSGESFLRGNKGFSSI